MAIKIRNLANTVFIATIKIRFLMIWSILAVCSQEAGNRPLEPLNQQMATFMQELTHSLVLCKMQLNALNDLAKANRRGTEKNLKTTKFHFFENHQSWPTSLVHLCCTCTVLRRACTGVEKKRSICSSCGCCRGSVTPIP